MAKKKKKRRDAIILTTPDVFKALAIGFSVMHGLPKRLIKAKDIELDTVRRSRGRERLARGLRRHSRYRIAALCFGGA